MKRLLTTLIGLGTAVCCTAQSIGPAGINAGGGSTDLAGNTYEFALGNLVAGSYTSSGLVVTPYALQPVTGSTGIEVPRIDAADLSVFPNPATHILNLQPRFKGKGILVYTFTDVLGRLIFSRELSLDAGNEKQEIDLSGLAAGQYQLDLLWKQKGKTARSIYKIQKIN